jgi:hypothetical protein
LFKTVVVVVVVVVIVGREIEELEIKANVIKYRLRRKERHYIPETWNEFFTGGCAE